MAYLKVRTQPYLIKRAQTPDDGMPKYDPVNVGNSFHAGVVPFSAVSVAASAIKSFMIEGLQATKIVAGTLIGFVIKTAYTVGNDTNGVILDKDGLRGYNAVFGKVFDLPTNGDRPTFSGGVIEQPIVNSPVVSGGEVRGATIVGGIIKTSDVGHRTEITDEGIVFKTDSTPGKYGDFAYNGGVQYGLGALAFINNSSKKVPFYVAAEQEVADLHLYNRGADPTGKAEVGDLAIVSGILKRCSVAGTPGTWVAV